MKTRLLPTYSISFIICLMLAFSSMAQKKTAAIIGKVVDENDLPLSKVSVVILGKQSGTTTSDSGKFSIKVTAEKAVALVFSSSGYKTEQRNFYLNDNEEERIVVRLEKGTTTLNEVVVTSPSDRKEVGLIRVNPKTALIIHATNGGGDY